MEDGNLVNVTKVKEWMTPLMANYCVIFDMDCNKTGCGYDDHCTIDQWCVESEETPGFQCIHKSEVTMNVKLLKTIIHNFHTLHLSFEILQICPLL